MSMSRKRFALACGILVILTCTVIGFLTVAGGLGQVTSLSQWETHTARPGFRLLDSADVAHYYICVYDTGLDEIAFCYRWHGSHEERHTHSLAIHDSSNQDLHDMGREQATSLKWTRDYGIATYAGSDGMVYPIREGYRGTIQIDFKDGDGPNGEYRQVYSKVLELAAETPEHHAPSDAGRPRR